MQKYISNFNILERQYLYYSEMSKLLEDNSIKKFNFLYDANRNYKFSAVVHLCNFLHNRSDICIVKLVKNLPESNKKDNLLFLCNSLIKEPHCKRIFNLRDKYISHRDDNWFKFDLDCPDGILEIYINTIKKILQEIFQSHKLSFELDGKLDHNKQFSDFKNKLTST